MNDDVRIGLGIAAMFAGVALVVGTIAFFTERQTTINGRAVVLYVENGQPVAKWKEEAK